MKTTLLLVFSFCSIFNYGQSPINDMFGGYPDIVASSIVTSAIPINEQPSGANAVWDFSLLLRTGYIYESHRGVSPSEISTFPNTTSAKVLTTILDGETQPSTTTIYTKLVNGVRSITGSASDVGFQINYSTNNAMIGTFPLSYGYSNTDTTAGTYVYDTYSGTFTGTITSSVDGYGMLNLNNLDDVLSPDDTFAVTRFKTVQNISINYGFLTNAGTVTITSYNYSSPEFFSLIYPVFQSITTSISVPLLSINQTTTQMIRTNDVQLANRSFDANDNLTISPNPTAAIFNINIAENKKVKTVFIYDNTGKEVLNFTNEDGNINISNLENGLYFVVINTDTGSVTKKVLKN